LFRRLPSETFCPLILGNVLYYRGKWRIEPIGEHCMSEKKLLEEIFEMALQNNMKYLG